MKAASVPFVKINFEGEGWNEGVKFSVSMGKNLL